MQHPEVPVYEPWLVAEDAEAVARAVRAGWISGQSPAVAELEQGFARHTGMPHAIAVSSGTLALELALQAAGIGPGDEVLCPAFCMIACARAIVAAGATPVLVDARAGDYNIDLELAERAVGPACRAILAVHTYGNPIAGDDLREFAARHALLVIEDAAEALGARSPLDGRLVPCGAVGDLSIFSLYANKAVTAGEGGVVLCRSEEHASRVRTLRNLGFSPERRFLHRAPGTNARLSGVAAALAASQLSRLDRTVARKQDVAAVYARRLKGAAVELPVPDARCRSVPWMVALTLPDSLSVDAAEVARRLRARGIDTRPFFLGMHRQPVFLERGLFRAAQFPVTERLGERGLYLPSSPLLDEPTIDRVVAELLHALEP